jgi:hypothetical protein
MACPSGPDRRSRDEWFDVCLCDAADLHTIPNGMDVSLTFVSGDRNAADLNSFVAMTGRPSGNELPGAVGNCRTDNPGCCAGAPLESADMRRV